MPQPKYDDGGWVTPSRFAYGPSDILRPASDYEECPCDRGEWKLKYKDGCWRCQLDKVIGRK